MKPERLAKSDVDHSQGLKKQTQSFNQAQGFYLKGTMKNVFLPSKQVYH